MRLRVRESAANFWGEITVREGQGRTAALLLQIFGRGNGKGGPIDELQLCCCKFLGEITVREVCCKFLGRDYGKGGLIQELQLCCCKFLGRDYGKGGPRKNCCFAAANFWGEMTVGRRSCRELDLDGKWEAWKEWLQRI